MNAARRLARPLDVRHCDGVVTLWIIGGLAVWLLVALVVGVVLGRGVHLADERTWGSTLLTTADLPGGAAGGPAAVPARRAAGGTRRRTVPLPPVGIGLALLAVGLETAGYITRVTGAHGWWAGVLSMDAPLSVPRMFVTAMFAGAALAALLAAGRLPGRRTWWTTVGLVAAGIATVKGGGTLHARAMSALSGAVGETGAFALSVALAAVVLGVLGFVSRAEQRDRRRILGILTLYALGSVGLSEVSAVVSGSFWTAAATYVEESGEALAAVAFLVGVLVGVAPRLVLPAHWVLRRQADAATLDAVALLPGQAPAGETALG